MVDKTLLILYTALKNAGLTPITIGDLPSQNAQGVAIRPVDGYPSTRYFGQKALNEPLIEIVFRSTEYATGENWYKTASKTLDAFSQSDDGVISCFITGSPGYLGKTSEGRNEWHLLLHATEKE